MPVVIMKVPGEIPRDERKRIVEEVTGIATDSVGVDADKVQVFIERETGTSGVTVHMVDEGNPSQGQAVARGLEAAGYDAVAIVGYAPDHTARGGKLREAEGAQG